MYYVVADADSHKGGRQSEWGGGEDGSEEATCED